MKRKLDIGDVVFLHDDRLYTTTISPNARIGIVTSGAFLDRRWNQDGIPAASVFFGDKYSSMATACLDEHHPTIRIEDLTYLGEF